MKKTGLTGKQIKEYNENGYIAPIDILSLEQVKIIREEIDYVEKKWPNEINGLNRNNIHYYSPIFDQIVHNSNILDVVEDIIGPNILCWASSFFNKDARDPSYVSWHQDSTYWGLSEPDVVTAWVALTPSKIGNGCMQVIPGTHTIDQVDHRDTNAQHNLLSRGQEVEVDVDESKAVHLELDAGEISLHHVRLIHGSPPNPSDQRRIGYAIRYIPPHVYQLYSESDTATLVRGEDRFNHFVSEPTPNSNMDPEVLEFHARANGEAGKVLYRGSSREPYFTKDGGVKAQWEQ